MGTFTRGLGNDFQPISNLSLWPVSAQDDRMEGNGGNDNLDGGAVRDELTLAGFTNLGALANVIDVA